MALWRHRSRKCRVIIKVHSDMKYSGMPQNYQKMFRNYINQKKTCNSMEYCLYIYIYIYIYIYAYSSPFILLRLNLGAFGGMVVWALCVIVADCGFTCQKRVCEKPFLTLAISAPLYININIIIRIKTYSFLSITFIPKISPSRYKLMEFWYAFFWPKNRKSTLRWNQNNVLACIYL